MLQPHNAETQARYRRRPSIKYAGLHHVHSLKMRQPPSSYYAVALLVAFATKTVVANRGPGASTNGIASPATQPASTTSGACTRKYGMGSRLHLPHMHAPHLHIPKGGFLFSPFRHHGGAHAVGNPAKVTENSGGHTPSIFSGMSVYHMFKHHSADRRDQASAAGLAMSNPTGGSVATAERTLGQGDDKQENQNSPHYPHLHMKSFFQSLRSWVSFKQYCCGVRDFLLIARPLETFLLRTGTVHDRDLSRFIARATAFVIISMIITSILGTLGLDTKPIIAGLGVSGFIGESDAGRSNASPLVALNPFPGLCLHPSAFLTVTPCFLHAPCNLPLSSRFRTERNCHQRSLRDPPRFSEAFQDGVENPRRGLHGHRAVHRLPLRPSSHRRRCDDSRTGLPGVHPANNSHRKEGQGRPCHSLGRHTPRSDPHDTSSLPPACCCCEEHAPSKVKASDRY